MSNGGVAVVPIALIVFAPIALAAAGAYGVGHAVVKGTQALVHAHAEGALRVQQRRRAGIRAHASRLRRRPEPADASMTPGSLEAIYAAVARLAKENDEWETLLAAEQAEYDRLSQELAGLEGRHVNLRRWAAEAALGERGLAATPPFGHLTAVEECAQQVAALAQDNADLEADLRGLWADRARMESLGVWQKIAMPPVSEVDRDPLSSTEKWRRPLRDRIANALADALGLAQVPVAISEARRLVESTDRAAAEQAVGRALEAVAEATARKATIQSFLGSVDALTTEAELMGNYVVLGRIDRAREEFDDRRDVLTTVQLSVWTQNQQRLLAADVQRAREFHEVATKADESARQAAVTELVHQQVRQLLAARGMAEIPLETGVPFKGHLFCEQGPDPWYTPTHGTFVGLDRTGSLKVWPVRLGETAQNGSEREADRQHCAAVSDLDGHTLLAELDRLLQALVPDAPTDEHGRVVAWEHGEFTSLFNVLLTGDQQAALQAAFARDDHMQRERARPLA